MQQKTTVKPDLFRSWKGNLQRSSHINLPVDQRFLSASDNELLDINAYKRELACARLVLSDLFNHLKEMTFIEGGIEIEFSELECFAELDRFLNGKIFDYSKFL